MRKTRAARFIFNKEVDDYFIHLNKEAIAIEVSNYVADLFGEGAAKEDRRNCLVRA